MPAVAHAGGIAGGDGCIDHLFITAVLGRPWQTPEQPPASAGLVQLAWAIGV